MKARISRIAYIRPPFPNFILYTDASWSDKKNSGRIAAILVDRSTGNIIDVLSSAAPASLVRAFKSSLVIYGLELFALVAASAVWQFTLSNSQVSAYVDNDPSSNGLVRGAAKFPIAHYMILRFWQLMCKRSISVWFERVPSPLNLADLPTRNRSLPVKSPNWREFPSLEFLVAHFTSKWSFTNDSSLEDKNLFSNR